MQVEAGADSQSAGMQSANTQGSHASTAMPQETHCTVAVTAAVAAARARFPRGLTQAERGPRFGLDALLLAAFAAQHCETAARQQVSAVELGCGCGAALLYLALRVRGLHGLGLDKNARAVDAAIRNATLLGLAEHLQFHCMDITALRHNAPIATVGENTYSCGRFDVVLANPPYGLPGQGRPSACALRERAFRQEDATLHFCMAAAALLRRHGHFFCIFDARALPRLLAACAQAHMGLRRIVPVRTYADTPALRVLVEVRKDAADDLRLENPLTLHVRKQAKRLFQPSQPDSLDTPNTCGQSALPCQPALPNTANAPDQSGPITQVNKARRTTTANGAVWSAQAIRFCPALKPDAL